VPQDALDRILTFAELKERIPFTRQHIGRLEAAGQFPKRVQLGECSVGWLESQVAEWIRSRPRGPIDLAARKLAKGAAA
jgi:prophage regulatory protein